MTYVEYRNAAEERSAEFYLRWKMYQCCPRCEQNHLHIRMMAKTKLNNERWKFNCRSCGSHWYGPDWVK